MDTRRHPAQPHCMPADSHSSLALAVDPTALRQLIVEVVETTLARLEQAHQYLPERLAFSEAEAAQLVGLQPWQLRDERRRGRIAASQIVGRQIRYRREDLVGYLMRCRINDPAD